MQTPVNWPYQLTSSKPSGEVWAKWTPKNYNLTVKYVDEDGNNIIAPITDQRAYDTTYTTEKKTFDNYEFVSDSGNTSGTIKGDTTVTYKYKQAPPQPTKLTYNVSWYNKATNEKIKATETRDSYNRNANLKEGDPVSVTGNPGDKGVEGWTYDPNYSLNVESGFLTADGKINVNGTVYDELRLYFDVDSSYQPPAQQHPLTYVSDGTTYGDTEQHAEGDQFNLRSAPAKSGYTFKGWQDADGELHDANSSFTMPGHDVTLTAVWEPNYSFKVVKVITSDTSNVKNGDLVDYKITITNTSPVTVYEMWVEDTMDKGLALEGEVHYTVNGGSGELTMHQWGSGKTGGDKTLYVWEPATRLDLEPNDYVTLTYQAKVTVTEETKLHNQTMAYAYKNDPSAPQSAAARNSYPVMALSAVMPLVGGTGEGPGGGTTNPVEHTVKFDSKDGYEFEGWYNEETGKKWNFGDSVIEDMTLTAHWTKKDTGNGGSSTPSTPSTTIHYLRYNANGGSGAPRQQSSGSTTATRWRFTMSSTVPTRDGYTFKGWATTANGEAACQPSGSIEVKGSQTLYAVWAENEPEEPADPNGGDIEIPEEDPPLSDVPETGDRSHIWGYFALISGAGLAMLALTARKCEEDAE